MPPDPPDPPRPPLEYAGPNTPRPAPDSELPESPSDFWRALSVVVAIMTALFLVLAMLCGGFP